MVEDPAELGDVVLDIRDMKKYYDVAASKMFGGGDTRTVKANESITFQAREAETVAIVGESGCGKSTLAKVLLGLETATDGDVLLGNVAIDEIGGRRPRQAHCCFGADGVSESIRHAEPKPFSGLADHADAGKISIGDSESDRKTACWNCSIW